MNARDALRMATVALDGLEMIARWVHLPVPAEQIVTAIRAALTAIAEGTDGVTSPQVVLAQLESLQTSLAANDVAADADLDRRFPK